MLSLLGLKAVSAFVFAATALCGAYLPVVLAKRGRAAGTRSLSFVLGNVVSAGVMMSAAFCHLLGAAIEQMHGIKYPLAPFLCAVGFLATLAIDQFVDAVTHRTPRFTAVSGSEELQGLNTAQTEDFESATGARERSGPQPRPAKPFVSFISACIMAAALCFQSVFEGAALGTQKNAADIFRVFIAVQAHKGLAAYALGSAIVDSAAEMCKFWYVIGTFASASPLGILLGTALSTVTTTRGAAAISALASGTFLHVAMMEVIPRELSSSQHRLLKLGMLILGFGMMSVLAIWT